VTSKSTSSFAGDDCDKVGEAQRARVTMGSETRLSE
jgi:hypothetical protein